MASSLNYQLPEKEFLVVYNVLLNKPEEMTDKDLKITVQSLGLTLEADEFMPKSKKEYMEFVLRAIIRQGASSRDLSTYSKKIWLRKFSSAPRSPRGKSIFGSERSVSSPKRKSASSPKRKQDQVTPAPTPAFIGVRLLLFLGWNGESFQMSADNILDLPDRVFQGDIAIKNEPGVNPTTGSISIERDEWGKPVVTKEGNLIYHKKYLYSDGSERNKTIQAPRFYRQEPADQMSEGAGATSKIIHGSETLGSRLTLASDFGFFPERIIEERKSSIVSVLYASSSSADTPREIKSETIYQLSNGEDSLYFLVFYNEKKRSLAIYRSITESWTYPRVYLKTKTFPLVGSFFVVPHRGVVENIRSVSSVCFQRRETLNYIYCCKDFLAFRAKAELVGFAPAPPTKEKDYLSFLAKDTKGNEYLLGKKTGEDFDFEDEDEDEENPGFFTRLGGLIKGSRQKNKLLTPKVYVVIPRKRVRPPNYYSYMVDPERVITIEDDDYPAKIEGDNLERYFGSLLVDKEGDPLLCYFPASNSSGRTLIVYNEKRGSVAVYQYKYDFMKKNKDEEVNIFILKVVYQKVTDFFVGSNPMTYRTLRYYTHDWKENSVLFRLGNSLKYVYYEEGYIKEFTALHRIIAFFCPQAPNDVTEPYALDEKYNLYLLSDGGAVRVIMDVGLDYEDLMDPPREEWLVTIEASYGLSGEEAKIELDIAGERIVKDVKRIEYEFLEISD